MTTGSGQSPQAASDPAHATLHSRDVELGLHQVIDPCMEAAGLGLSIVDLGLVRNIRVTDTEISVELGLTEPGCGFTHALVTRIDDAIAALAGHREIRTTFNWSDPWTEERLSDRGRAVIHGARARGSDVIASTHLNA